MPRYSFICEDCQFEFDLKCKFEELDSKKCPKCHSEKLERLYKSIGISMGDTQESKCST